MQLEVPPWAEEAWMQWPIKEGLYKMRPFGREHWSKRPYQPVSIKWEMFPDEDNPMFCVWDWLVLLNGQPSEISVVWPWSSKYPITEEEYTELLSINIQTVGDDK